MPVLAICRERGAMARLRAAAQRGQPAWIGSGGQRVQVVHRHELEDVQRRLEHHHQPLPVHPHPKDRRGEAEVAPHIRVGVRVPQPEPARRFARPLARAHESDKRRGVQHLYRTHTALT
eukprot:CAMPEP_0181246256 /NCGR_PEP_ID=MMETSP1096-20121128/43906_1 /TAXON_ID=156174 ORGANISM="Chrysochromulina ericina, Strain CCMP281" /NCGR_SAMPLE_ID=MMETSP1096 /ASSEMBLY_ACC=CAM_ASM_000453 /LENGTH=118 /DNA_ID=CAMNT_0023343079 /DNA_START=1329 /DNA_END=1685 /DNA_ORIENTATION=+